jgi:hypothetical protein
LPSHRTLKDVPKNTSQMYMKHFFIILRIIEEQTPAIIRPYTGTGRLPRASGLLGMHPLQRIKMTVAAVYAGKA